MATAPHVVNEIVVLDARTPGEPQVLVTGPDFVAAPRCPRTAPPGLAAVGPPAMPWDAAELVIRDLATGEETVVAGGRASRSRSRGGADGSLWFLSDRTDWWNLYRWLPGRDIEAVVRTEAGIGVPAWASAAPATRCSTTGGWSWRAGAMGSTAWAAWSTAALDLDLPFTAVGAVVAAGRTGRRWWRQPHRGARGAPRRACPAQTVLIKFP